MQFAVINVSRPQACSFTHVIPEIDIWRDEPDAHPLRRSGKRRSIPSRASPSAPTTRGYARSKPTSSLSATALRSLTESIRGNQTRRRSGPFLSSRRRRVSANWRQCGRACFETRPWALLSMRKSSMALRKLLVLRKLRSSCLEGRTALIQPIVDFLTPSKPGAQGNGCNPWISACAGMTKNGPRQAGTDFSQSLLPGMTR
jgi:hypothetical protein